ncbi:MAG: hypothetical protein COS92_00235 [Desulfobacterales bacterium CG07_land_8_20_14_0_80_52_14]|nr:MAG: hypothetical protein COS92_00235 [Desulfobacterales bacterium CG07_land_8_20_14_0_80_52_14]
MKKKTRPLFAWVVFLITAGGVFLFLKTVTVIALRNPDDRNFFYFSVAPSEQMTLCYTNSIYNAYVEEVFEVRKGNIVLKAVRTASPAVMEYYGFEGSGPVQAMNRSLGPTFWIKASMRQDQSLRIGEKTIDLRALGNRGDRVQIRVEDVSLAFILFSGIFRRQDLDASIKKP